MIQRKTIFALTASCCQSSHSWSQCKARGIAVTGFQRSLTQNAFGINFCCTGSVWGVCVTKSIPSQRQIMKQRMLSGVKAVLAFQHQMWFLCGVISSNDTWWVVGCVFSSPISCLCMSSTFIKLNRTKLKTDATCWSRYCGTNATWMLWQNPKGWKIQIVV